MVAEYYYILSPGAGGAVTGNVVRYNYIGTDITGALDLGNQLTASKSDWQVTTSLVARQGLDSCKIIFRETIAMVFRSVGAGPVRIIKSWAITLARI